MATITLQRGEKMNRADIEFLIDEYGDYVYNFCRKLARNKFDSDDLYQKVFLKAIEIADKISKDNNPKCFLISLAIGIWKNDIRKYARRQRIAPSISIYDDNIDYVDNSINIEDITISNDIREQFLLIIHSLGEKLSLPILLYYSANLSEKEIAKSMRCPIGTVKSRLFRAKQLIRERLEGSGYEP